MGVLGGCLVGLTRLVVTAPGEALLALAAGLGAALDVALADLGVDDRAGREPGDGEAALADEEHSPAAREP